jgi:ketosteroid isomerase-like protein
MNNLQYTDEYGPDGLAVRAAVQAYAHAIDAFDWDALASVFTTDAVARYQGREPVHGNVAIARFLQDAVGPSTWHQHFISTTEVRFKGSGVAHLVSAFIAHSISPARPGKVRMTLGSYQDKLIRTDMGWRISEREQITGMREVRDLGDPNG